MKHTVDELAILGGAPEFAEPLHVGYPNLGDREIFFSRLNKIFDSRRLTNNGPYVQELEQRLADLLQVPHVVAVCNGTLALELTIRALGFHDEVIVPSLTFVATVHALTMQGITPVFCDIDPDTHNLDPALVQDLLSPRTTGILGVHLWGRACPVDAFEALARQHNLGILYDAAHAFACSWGGRMLGGFGDAEVFSFHATKFFHTLEGGAVATNDAQLADQIRLLRNFGFSGYDNVVSLGTNAKMNEVSAAMGLTLLDRLDDFISINRRNYEIFRRELDGLEGVHLVNYDPAESNNYQYIVLEIDPAAAGLKRDQLSEILWAENVRTRRYFYPGVHRMEPYRTIYPGYATRLPETERMVERLLSIPTGADITPEKIQAICQIIRLVMRHADRLDQSSEGSGL